MHFSVILQLMALLILTNGAPVIAKKVFGSRFSLPLDGGLTFFDGRPVFGPSKTYRGILMALLAGAAGAPLVGLDLRIGITVAAAAMAGDLLSSFVKRRLNMPPSSQGLGLDQIPESLFPMLACRTALSLTSVDILLGVGIFFAGELVLSRFLYRANLRDEPY
jgi:CDP-2,3-bis-(O-geranylgeranyl)-sn-glycerol synthase